MSRNLKVVKCHALCEVQNEVLHERTTKARSGRSQEFIAFVNGAESALLSYEDWSDELVGFIYEIYVLPDFKKQGIGAALLSYAENIALQLGCTSVRLKPYALDHNTDTEWLVSWYERKGYIPKSDDAEVMEKKLAPTQAWQFTQTYTASPLS